MIFGIGFWEIPMKFDEFGMTIQTQQLYITWGMAKVDF